MVGVASSEKSTEMQSAPMTPMASAGRDKELVIVREHVRNGKNLVVFGPEGVGKTALVTAAVNGMANVLYCADTATLKTACESLLAQLKLKVAEADNIVRKRAILQAAARKKRCFVFDNVGWVAPKLLSFLENIREKHSMVIVTRSIAWSDIGHLHLMLWDFDKLELAPLSRVATLQVLRAQMERLKLRVPDPAEFEANVLRLSGHNLHLLMKLCRQASTGKYVFGGHLSTSLLEIDRRIAELGTS
ncbi:MAG: ATP-binding protein [Verrucomicrobia bacterium]|nr:ATP-binding protein [Verrucomicrobiota bacterium]